MLPKFRPAQELGPGRPVIACGTDNNVILELTQLFCEPILEREEEDVATATVRGSSGCLNEVQSDKRGVITDDDAGRHNRSLVDLFFISAEFRPLCNGIIHLLFV